MPSKGWHETAKYQTKRQTTNSNSDPDDGRVASFQNTLLNKYFELLDNDRVHNDLSNRRHHNLD
jgi:hypothetical protein